MDLIKRDDAISAVDVFSNTASVLNLMELPAVDAIPRERIEQMVTEIKQLSKDYAAEGDKSFKNEFYLDRSVGVDKALEIVRKYTKEQNND